MVASNNEISRTETILRGPVPCRTFTVSASGRSTGFPLSISGLSVCKLVRRGEIGA